MKEISIWRHNRFALVDDEDYPVLAKHRWRLLRTSSGHEYARASIGGTTVLMHRFILGAGKGVLVDHKSGDGLDCRRENIRIATYSQNGSNRVSKINGQFPGVHRVKTGWIVRARVNGSVRYFGHFKDHDQAVQVAREASIEVHGNFSPYHRLELKADKPQSADICDFSRPDGAESLHAVQAAKRLVRFMRSTNSIAPLQWLAEQMGCDLVQRDSRAAEVAALKQRLNELEKAA